MPHPLDSHLLGMPSVREIRCLRKKYLRAVAAYQVAEDILQRCKRPNDSTRHLFWVLRIISSRRERAREIAVDIGAVGVCVRYNAAHIFDHVGRLATSQPTYYGAWKPCREADVVYLHALRHCGGCRGCSDVSKVANRLAIVFDSSRALNSKIDVLYGLESTSERIEVIDRIQRKVYRLWLEAIVLAGRIIITATEHQIAGAEDLLASFTDLEFKYREEATAFCGRVAAAVAIANRVAQWRGDHVQVLEQDGVAASESADPAKDDELFAVGEGFLSLRWGPETFTFKNGLQSDLLRTLWTARQSGDGSISEKAIGRKINTAADSFKVRKVLRTRVGEKWVPHQALDRAIVSPSKGVFRLVSPPSTHPEETHLPQKKPFSA